MEQFEVLGWWDDQIFFKLEDKVIIIDKRLPREDMILKLRVEPEDVKSLRDEILVEASKCPLKYDDKEILLRASHA